MFKVMAAFGLLALTFGMMLAVTAVGGPVACGVCGNAVGDDHDVVGGVPVCGDCAEQPDE